MSCRFTYGTFADAYYDKTVSSLTSLFLALVLYPEVQKRAQAELDTVITRDRLPTFDDRPRLPYIDAMCRELMRWQMVTPLGAGLDRIGPIRGAEESSLEVFPTLQLRTTSTVAFSFQKVSFSPCPAPCGSPIRTLERRYHGSQCVVRHHLGSPNDILMRCVRAILHNPDLYPDPEAYKPERFLNEDGTFRDDPVVTLAFGTGKRICPGRHFVDSTLFIVVSSVLAVFDVVKAKDKNGREIPVNVAASFDNSIVV